MLAAEITRRLTPEAWRAVGAAGEPGFLNSWLNFGGTFDTAGFRKTPAGRVELKGTIKSGTLAAAFALPAGYRPAADKAFAAVKGAAAVAPTILDLDGAEGVGPTDGRSLVPLLEGEAPDWRTALLSENPGYPGVPSHKMVRTEDHSYVEWGDGFRELYDTRADPHQLDNLLHEPTPEAEAKAAELSARLDALKGCSGDSCRAAEDAPAATAP